MEPGPLILPPKEPRKIQTAHEILAWVITQDGLGELVQDPVSAPARIVP